MANEISGCDFSSWSGAIDYEKAKSVMRFALIRASQGIGSGGFGFVANGFKDPLFDKHWAGMRGIPRGATHFLDYTTKHYQEGKEIEFGRAQGDYLHSIIKNEPGEIVPQIDFETNEAAGNWEKLTVFNIGRTSKIFLAMWTRLFELTGKHPITYTPEWIAKYLKNAIQGALWMPRYQSNSEILPNFLTWDQLRARYQPGTGAWPKWSIWQYTSRLVGRNFGMIANDFMDGDIFNGNEYDFSIFLGENTIPTWPVENEDPVVVEPVVSKTVKVVSLDGVNLRSGVGTGSPQWWLNGKKYVHPVNQKLDVHEVLKDSAGNPWIRSGLQYACMKYGGVQLLEFV